MVTCLSCTQPAMSLHCWKTLCEFLVIVVLKLGNPGGYLLLDNSDKETSMFDDVLSRFDTLHRYDRLIDGRDCRNLS